MPPNGTKNLKPPTKKEARERGKKGGVQSGIARRRKKTFKEVLKAVVTSGMHAKELVMLKKMGFNPEQIENSKRAFAFAIAYQKAAQKGDVETLLKIEEVLGEYKPAGDTLNIPQLASRKIVQIIRKPAEDQLPKPKAPANVTPINKDV